MSLRCQVEYKTWASTARRTDTIKENFLFTLVVCFRGTVVVQVVAAAMGMWGCLHCYVVGTCGIGDHHFTHSLIIFSSFPVPDGTVISACSHLIFSADKADDELEMTTVCHRPEGLEQLEAQTNFTKQELQILYRGFKNVIQISSIKTVISAAPQQLSCLLLLNQSASSQCPKLSSQCLDV